MIWRGRHLHRHRAGGAREGQQPRGQRIEPKADLQHQRQQKWQSAQSHAEQKPANRRRRIGRDPHQREVDDRMRHPGGVADIKEGAAGPDSEQPDDRRHRQCAAPDILKAEGERCQPDAGQRKAPVIERPAAGLLEVADKEIDQHDPQDADRNVDEEDPAPGGVSDDKAAERRSHHRSDQRRDADIGHGANQIGFRHRPQQHQTADRHHHCPSHALNNARDDKSGE